jgi:hypothetical protein
MMSRRRRLRPMPMAPCRLTPVTLPPLRLTPVAMIPRRLANLVPMAQCRRRYLQCFRMNHRGRLRHS